MGPDFRHLFDIALPDHGAGLPPVNEERVIGTIPWRAAVDVYVNGNGAVGTFLNKSTWSLYAVCGPSRVRIARNRAGSNGVEHMFSVRNVVCDKFEVSVMPREDALALHPTATVKVGFIGNGTIVDGPPAIAPSTPDIGRNVSLQPMRRLGGEGAFGTGAWEFHTVGLDNGLALGIETPVLVTSIRAVYVPAVPPVAAWLLIFDKDAAAGLGDTDQREVIALPPAGGNMPDFLPVGGFPIRDRLQAVVSSTAGSYTPVAAMETWISFRYYP